MTALDNLSPIVIFQTVIRVIVLNLLFLITNLPLVIIIFLSGLKSLETPSLVLMLSSLTLGPSLIALFKSFYHMLNQTDASVYRIFSRTYLGSFSKELYPFILIQLLLFALSYSSLAFELVPILRLLSPLYFILTYLGIMMLLFLSQELALFKNTFQQTLKNSFILIVTRPLITLLTVMYGLFSLLILNEFPASLLLFTFSLFSFLFVSFSFQDCRNRIEAVQN